MSIQVLFFISLFLLEEVENKIGERVATAVAGLILDSDDEEPPENEDVRRAELSNERQK